MRAQAKYQTDFWWALIFWVVYHGWYSGKAQNSLNADKIAGKLFFSIVKNTRKSAGTHI